MKECYIFIIAILIYCIGALEYSYHSLSPLMETVNDVYSSVFVTWRNGLFNAFIYAFIGSQIANGRLKNIKYNKMEQLYLVFYFLLKHLQ